MPTKLSTHEPTIFSSLGTLSQQNPTMVTCKEYIVILKGFNVWQ